MQGTQGDAVDAGLQEMEGIWTQGVQGLWGDANMHGHVVPGGCGEPFQGLGEQWGVCQVSSLGAVLTCPQHSPAHPSPIPAPMPNGRGGQQ